MCTADELNAGQLQTDGHPPRKANIAGSGHSGGARAVKEPGHFEVRRSSRQVTQMHFFSSKKLTFFSCRPQNTGCQRRFTVKIKQIKRSDMVTFLFSVNSLTGAKQYAG